MNMTDYNNFKIKNTLYEYVLKNYSEGEPIFQSDTELPCKGIRLERMFDDLCADNKISRFDKGVYYRPFGRRLKGRSKLPPEVVMHHKYVEHRGKVSGYYAGYTFANQIGLTIQVPFTLEIATNKANADKSITEIQGQRAYLYKPRTAVTAQNRKILQLLDLVGKINIYAEQDEEMRLVLKRYIQNENIEISMINKFLHLYPELSINRTMCNFLGNLFDMKKMINYSMTC